jgi:hypothetical protein
VLLGHIGIRPRPARRAATLFRSGAARLVRVRRGVR